MILDVWDRDFASLCLGRSELANLYALFVQEKDFYKSKENKNTKKILHL